MSSDGASWASTPSTRRSMLGNKGRDTKPELAVRKQLHALGYRYKVDARPLPSLNRRADLVFSARQVAVFVHGCFWHGCPDHYTLPKRNTDFWLDKVARNRLRDEETLRTLAEHGWTAIVIWEHEELPVAVARVQAALENR